MSAAIVVLLAICVLLGAFLVWSERRLYQFKRQTEQQFGQWIAELKGRYEELLSEKQGHATNLTQEREAYKDLTAKWAERIGSISESLKAIGGDALKAVGDMSTTLKPIVAIFRSPQAAGIEFGEAELELLLTTHLGEGLYLRKPRLLAMGQEVVDFAIKLPDCLVPMDSKFPSTCYKAWVEAPSDEEARAAWRAFRDAMLDQLAATAKYIKPDAGTTDYALLFVPSDVIYQQAFLSQRVYDQDNPIPRRSQELQVFGCSTQTLMPYLGLIRLGLRNLKVSEDAKAIRSQIEQLDRLFKSFSGDWEVLRGHVERLSGHVQKVGTGRGSLARLGDAIRRLSSPSASEKDPELPLESEQGVTPEAIISPKDSA